MRDITNSMLQSLQSSGMFKKVRITKILTEMRAHPPAAETPATRAQIKEAWEQADWCVFWTEFRCSSVVFDAEFCMNAHFSLIIVF